MSGLLIDWDVAAAAACRLVPAGPEIGYADAAAVVADLRAAAAEMQEHVTALTGLSGDPEAGPVVVVDRPAWIRGNVAGFRHVVDPLTERLLAQRGSAPPAWVSAVGSRVTGAQTGALLAYLATKVLGQYEVFLPRETGRGRLSLVAPNVVATEQALDVVPHDFRRWVALHEVTHRVQFTAVGWLADHVLSEITAFLLASDLDPAALAGRLREALSVAVDAARGRREAPSLVEIVQTPEQRVVLDRITGLMSLLEGHAEFVMDRVGPEVIPSVGELRRRFDARRAGSGPLDRLVRRLLGIEMKMRQYAEGAAFVRAVVDARGMAGFNGVWAGPQALPTAEEVRQPARWLTRVPAPGDGPAAATA
jgi:coenzyme F420 biosynthesis associated uncharacterized protein